MGDGLRRMLPHVTIIMALFLGTFWVLNQLNPFMGFMENSFMELLQIVFCFIVLFNGIQQVWQRCLTEKE